MLFTLFLLKQAHEALFIDEGYFNELRKVKSKDLCGRSMECCKLKKQILRH